MIVDPYLLYVIECSFFVWKLIFPELAQLRAKFTRKVNLSVEPIKDSLTSFHYNENCKYDRVDNKN